MATGVQVWSQTPASNATADSNINWAEGQAPSSVNDSARAMMASVAKWRDDNSGTLTTSGSSSALTVVTNQVEGALTTGFTFTATLGTAIAASATMAVDGLTATNIYTALSTASQVTTGQFAAAGQMCSFTFSTSVGGLASSVWVIKTYALPYLTTLTNSISADASTPTTAYVDGPSVAQGTTGVWYASGTISYVDTALVTNMFAKLYDGTTVIAAATCNTPAAAIQGSVTLSGTITNPAGNIRMALASPRTTSKMLFNASGFSKDSTITVVRIG